jgi:hypothetical protein
MIRARVDASDLEDMARALRYEQDGREMRRDLLRNLRVAIKPAEAEAKTGILSMGSAGLHTGRSLRAAIAAQVKSEARLTGRSVGIRVKARKRGMPRGFANAPKRTNSARGWRHPTLGRGATGAATWVHQTGKPGWFDTPMHSHSLQYREAVHQALESTARRLTRRV